MLTQLYTKRHSCVQTQFIRLEFNAEASSVEFREFILLVTISLQSCQRSNSSSNSVDSSYFCRIAYRDLFSQMHALCRRHTFNHCNEPPWLNSRVKFTCGFSHSQGRYDAWNSRITTGLWQIPRPKYTLAKSWKTVSCHECKVWLPHGRLKASLGHTELKGPSLSVDIWMSGCLKEKPILLNQTWSWNDWMTACRFLGWPDPIKY